MLKWEMAWPAFVIRIMTSWLTIRRRSTLQSGLRAVPMVTCVHRICIVPRANHCCWLNGVWSDSDWPERLILPHKQTIQIPVAVHARIKIIYWLIANPFSAYPIVPIFPNNVSLIRWKMGRNFLLLFWFHEFWISYFEFNNEVEIRNLFITLL